MDAAWWAGQTLGFVAMAVVLTSHWSRERRATVTRNAWASVLFAVHYLLLGLPGTAAIPAINAVRSWLYSWAPAWVSTRILAPVFIAVTWAAYLLISGPPSWWAEWLPPIGSSLSAIALSLRDVRAVKTVMLAAVSTWIVYEAAFGLWGVLGGEVIGLGLTIAALTLSVRERSDPAERATHA